MPTSALRVVNVYPTLLGTYGDRGNASVLVVRARERGIPVETVEVGPEDPVPAGGDLYVLGGAEDAAQVTAVTLLRQDGGLRAALDAGASLLAVCAGFQIVGEAFSAGGHLVDGLSLVDVRSLPGEGPRCVGELLTEPGADGLPVLTGYENHAGVTRLGPGTRPLGRVLAGTGNGDGADGVLTDRVVGTYLHGPVLARNPALADLLLRRVVGDLPPLDDTLVEAFRAQRITATLLDRRARPGRRRLGLGRSRR